MPYDIAVVGGGPAGLSAAINARARGKSVVVVGNDYRESPLYRAERVDNYLGMPGMTGAQLLEAYRRHAESMEVDFRAGRVLNIMQLEGTCYLSIGSEMETAKAVVLATGVVRGKKLPGEVKYLGRGVSYCATCDGMLYRGKPVVVVGMAPDAPEEANFLQGIGCQVTYVSARAPEGLVPAIPYVKSGRLEIVGEDGVTALRVGDTELPAQCAFLLRSAMPPGPAPRPGSGGERVHHREPTDGHQSPRHFRSRGLYRTPPPALKGHGGGAGGGSGRRRIRGSTVQQLTYLLFY